MTLPIEFRSPVVARWPKGQKVQLAFVGGAPDWKAVNKLTPFVAEAGRILDVCMRLANIDPQIFEVFKITKLDRIFKIHDTTEKALASLK